MPERDPLLEAIAERRSWDEVFNCGNLDDDSPEYEAANSGTHAVWLRLCGWGSARTRDGAIEALKLALDDIDIGPGDLAPAMIRSALAFLEAA